VHGSYSVQGQCRFLWDTVYNVNLGLLQFFKGQNVGSFHFPHSSLSKKTPQKGCESAFSSQKHKIFKLLWYQNYSDSHQILHSVKDHQVLFVGHPKTCHTIQDSGWLPSLKKEWIAISKQLCDLCWQNFAQWRILIIMAVQKFIIFNSRWRTATILKTIKGDISTTVFTDFYEIWYHDADWLSQTDQLPNIWNFENPWWRPSAILKVGKLWYLHSQLAEFYKILHSDAYWPSDSCPKIQTFSARCNIYISHLCYDVSVGLSVCLSVTFVHCGHRV